MFKWGLFLVSLFIMGYDLVEPTMCVKLNKKRY